jgi:hypothetical protein
MVRFDSRVSRGCTQTTFAPIPQLVRIESDHPDVPPALRRVASGETVEVCLPRCVPPPVRGLRLASCPSIPCVANPLSIVGGQAPKITRSLTSFMNSVSDSSGPGPLAGPMGADNSAEEQSSLLSVMETLSSKRSGPDSPKLGMDSPTLMPPPQARLRPSPPPRPR